MCVCDRVVFLTANYRQTRNGRSACCLVTSSHQLHHDNAAAETGNYIDPVRYDEIGRHGYHFTREIDPDSVTIESIISRGKGQRRKAVGRIFFGGGVHRTFPPSLPMFPSRPRREAAPNAAVNLGTCKLWQRGPPSKAWRSPGCTVFLLRGAQKTCLVKSSKVYERPNSNGGCVSENAWTWSKSCKCTDCTECTDFCVNKFSVPFQAIDLYWQDFDDFDKKVTPIQCRLSI